MSEYGPLIGEAFFAVVVFAFAFWQLRELNQLKRERERKEREAEEANAQGPGTSTDPLNTEHPADDPGSGNPRHPER